MSDSESRIEDLADELKKMSFVEEVEITKDGFVDVIWKDNVDSDKVEEEIQELKEKYPSLKLKDVSR